MSTGDTTNTLLYISILVTSMILIGVLVKKRKTEVK
ncbi:MAG: LPXTG cell wall anchor domain-containing protein [Coprobacillaceae bacterium]